VLLTVMNWFFHKVYWGGWIALHNRQKKRLLAEADRSGSLHWGVAFGLGLLGFQRPDVRPRKNRHHRPGRNRRGVGNS
jgi:hypothetical protein